MAAGQIPVKQEQEVDRTVYCSECLHFKRDTEGISRRADTGEYFMGVCLKGRHPDTSIRQFADKPRKCSAFDAK